MIDKEERPKYALLAKDVWSRPECDLHGYHGFYAKLVLRSSPEENLMWY